jgi:hypothetical protein
MDMYSFKRVLDDPNAVPLQQLLVWALVWALMAPPGHPEFVSRTRLVLPGHRYGTVHIEGKAWAGAVELDRRVEFSSEHGTNMEIM